MTNASGVSETLVVGPSCGMSGCPNGRGNTMGRRGRAARAVAGAGFLVIAGAIASRQLPGGISLRPAAVVPTWFGVAHLVASVTGYRGCPELGAIPSVMLGRQVETGCGPWERIDRWVDRGTID
jgi:hypothetical protein